MQHFDRGSEPPPESLTDEKAQEAKRWVLGFLGLGAQRQSQVRIDMASQVIRTAELDEGAARLFGNRCAFCESEARLTAYRFRPVEEAEPGGAAPDEDADRRHLYYAWLANAWENIYAICEDCVPSAPFRFDVRGKRCRIPSLADLKRFERDRTGLWRLPIAEQPMLLDPCADENLRTNLAALPSGELVGLTTRAATTIGHFHLNRDDLVRRRGRAYHARLDALIHDHDGQSWDEVLDFAGIEFGGTWFLLLYRLARLFNIGRANAGNTSMRNIGNLIRGTMRDRDGPGRLRWAVARFEAEHETILARRVRVPMPAGSAKPIRVEIRNFKAIEHLDLELAGTDAVGTLEKGNPPTPAVLILGENSAGKSSILEAVALATAGQAARDDLSVAAASLPLLPKLMGGKETGDVRTSSIRTIYDDGGTSELLIGLDGFSETPHPDAAPVFAYGAFRMFLNAGKRQRPSGRIRSLFEPGYVLPNPEVWLASIHGTPAFSEVARALRSVLAIGGDFDVIGVDKATGTCSITTQVTGGGGEVVETATPLSVVSSGFRSVLGMICDVMRGLLDDKGSRATASLANARATVLIDEVEAHLHPRWKMQIVRGLRDALPNVTFLATTHDPLCLRDLASGEVVVLRRVLSAGSGFATDLPTIVERLETLPPMAALTVEQLLTSDLFQLFSTDEAAMGGSLAEIGDLLAAERTGTTLRPSQVQLLDQARRRIVADVAQALPIGSTEVERLVQEAVEIYLRERRGLTSARMRELRAGTRAEIVRALGRA